LKTRQLFWIVSRHESACVSLFLSPQWHHFGKGNSLMRYLAIATDYDGTLAQDGEVEPETLKALAALKKSGRKIILVSGREFADLQRVFPEYEIFDRLVLENGATVYDPSTKKETVLTPEPSAEFVARLEELNVSPLAVGKGIVATWEPHQDTVLRVIKELGLELQIIFNKSAVMILPSGVNKQTGLEVAAAELGLSLHNIVAIGDAENDQSFMAACELSVAVANALPSVKERADLVTKESRGAGVRELIQTLIRDDAVTLSPARHNLNLGRRNSDNTQVDLDVYNVGILLAGTSGGGKSSTTLSVIEQLSKRQYQFVLIDPEGDYESFDNAIVIGDAHTAPPMEEIVQILNAPNRSVIVNLLGVPLADRPDFFASLMPRLLELRTTKGRPHWIVVDEAHHMFPSEWKKMGVMSPENLRPIIMITVHPERIAPQSAVSIDVVVAIGREADKIVNGFARQASLLEPVLPPGPAPKKGEGLVWFARTDSPPDLVQLSRGELEKIRHRRKYAQGNLPEEISFFFRGPDNRLNLRVQNLTIFNQIAAGVDDETWLHHLKQHDYSRWFRDVIKDPDLAREAALAECNDELSPLESRSVIEKAISDRYTAPA
jgi:HAD superfamily hydrolase (TIGR01484 family)